MPFKTVLIKGIGKIKFPDSMSDEAIEQSIRNLDMSESARMARAKEQGFNKKTYRGMQEEYIEGKERDIIWSTPDVDYANLYAEQSKNESGANIMPTQVRYKKPFDFGFRDASTYVKKADMLERVKDSLLNDYNEGIIEERKAKLFFDKIKKLQKESSNDYKPVWQWWQEDKDILDILKYLGYDSLISREGPNNTIAIGVFDPKNIRSTNAAFNPDLKDSPSLLASAPPALIGAGLASKSNQSEAQTGVIEGPKYPAIASIKSFIDANDDILIDDMLGGLTSYLDKLSYDDKITFKDRLLMALDLI